MAFSVKNWKNSSDTTTPVSAEALEDMEERLSQYVDDTLTGGGGTELGYAEITSNATVTSGVGAADVAGLSVSVTVASRPIIIKVNGPGLSNDGNGATSGFQIKEGATTFGGQTRLETESSASVKFPVAREIRLAPSAGAHTYKVTIISVTAGTTTLYASATDPCFIQVLEV